MQLPINQYCINYIRVNSQAYVSDSEIKCHRENCNGLNKLCEDFEAFNPNTEEPVRNGTNAFQLMRV